ncbi:SnoaL-like polyketide cyclase [Actinomadura rubteroloni]|uniref:SnoaL-like polyketide cyclase n=1 Tax=Actinomadura rubteroloni TaxID=1926885 RepID=A0A2P4UEK9_9ACTN|nr:ester cyclase [Actinomadura rubteroloni]POM23504.1 SnoaL-like polyketide cyclase [Actinomadura rubteroloni]
MSALTARRIIEEGFSKGDVDVLDEVMTPDFVNHNAPPGMDTGIDGVKQVIRVERTGFPDLNVEIIRDFEVDGFVIQQVRLTGTHKGPVFGVPATGRTVVWNEIHIAKIRDGRVAEHWACNDLHSLLMQIGKIDPPDVSAFSLKPAEQG